MWQFIKKYSMELALIRAILVTLAVVGMFVYPEYDDYIYYVIAVLILTIPFVEYAKKKARTRDNL